MIVLVKEFFKVVRCGTMEELVQQLTQLLDKGWYIEEMDGHRTEFFQEHYALLVSENYLHNRKKYYSFFEDKRPKQEFNINLQKEHLEKKGMTVKK